MTIIPGYTPTMRMVGSKWPLLATKVCHCIVKAAVTHTLLEEVWSARPYSTSLSLPFLSFAHHRCVTIFPDLSLYQAGTSPRQKKRWPILCVRRGRKSGQAAHSTSGFEPLVAPTHIAWEPTLWRFSKQILIIRIISKLSTVSLVNLHHIFQITKALRTLLKIKTIFHQA